MSKKIETLAKEEQKRKWRLASKKYKNKHKDRVIQNALKIAKTEKGFLKIKYNSISQSKKGSEFKNFEEFYNVWLHQKTIYDLFCPLTGKEMTIKVGHNRNNEKFQACLTNLSIDRIINWKPYSAKNLIFVSWKVNKIKNSITPSIAKRFVRIAEARFGKEVCGTRNDDLIYGEQV
tara:strand:- start:56 stop:583 length:528 start_codon:yes stop_codon:yes gene_type:complete